MAGFYPGTKPRAWSILHIINVIIAIVAMIVTAYRLIAIMDMRITSRADIIALGAGAKTIIVLAYQHFSESRQKFASLKAFFILDLIEVGIWGAAGGMTIAATLRRCEGVSCSLSWTVAVLALILCLSSIYATYLTFAGLRTRKSRTQAGKMEKIPSSQSIV